jgi:hypothetical protein
MNQREVIEETARLAAERGWTEGSPQETYLLELLSAREETRHGLVLKVQTLRGDLDRLEHVLSSEYPKHPMLNSLGELQQRPSAVEAAVGEFAATDRALQSYLKGFPAGAGQ